MIYVGLAFILGLCVGSFLNVVVLRGSQGQSLSGRSYCDSCKKMLGWIELIPVISFVLQKGRCRNCGSRLFLQYPLVELGTGVLFSFSTFFIYPYLFDYWGWLMLLAAFASTSAIVVIIVSDIKFFLIPNGAVLTLLLVGIGATIYRKSYFVPDITAAFLFSLFLFLLWAGSKGKWMGLGDAKLIFATSLVVGFPAALAAFLFSFWSGAILSLTFIILGEKHLADIIPFGPFIILGGVLSVFLSDEFIYLSGLSEIVLFL